MSDVVEFPASPGPPPLLVGPFEEYRVVVEGRQVPRLTGFPQADGRITLILDRRLMIDLPNEEIARQVAWLVANALAIGEGFSHLGAETRDRPFAPTCMEITS